MDVQTLIVGPLQVNCHIVVCAASRQALVVDPGAEGERILAAIETAGLQLKTIVNTHGHFDHVGANRFFVEKTGAELLIHAAALPLLRDADTHAAAYGLTAESSPEPDRLLADGETVVCGEVALKVLHVPGHSPGGLCLYGEGELFSGDAIFAGSVGRTDLPGGDHETLLREIRDRLLTLPAETVVHPGHGPDTTIGRERLVNPFVGDDVY